MAYLLLLRMVLLVWITVINNSHKVKVSDGAKKIFVSFLQFASLAAGMSIPWPENYVGLFAYKVWRPQLERNLWMHVVQCHQSRCFQLHT